MQNIAVSFLEYVSETRHLDLQPSSIENTFYPAIMALLSAILEEGRVNTSEASAKARDQRIPALLALSPELKPLYQRIASDAFTAAESGIEL